MARILYLTEGYSVHDWRFLSKIAATHEVWYQPCVEQVRKTESRALPQAIHACPALAPEAKRFSWLHVPGMLRTLKKRMKEVAPDVIHAGSVPTGGFLAALSGFKPLLIMSWGSDVLVQAKKNFMQRLIAKYALGQASMALGDCDAVSKSIQGLSKLKDADIVQIPWGIRLSDFKDVKSNGLREKLGWEGKTVLIATRGFEPIHCPLLLLEAFCFAQRNWPDVRLLMLGTGRLETRAKAFVQDKGLGELVHFASQIPNAELPSYFKASDLFVSGTLSDGTSISLLEAMASGLPVIVTDAYGNQEWVKHNVNGWRYEAGNPVALTRALEHALAQRNTFVAMGKTNQERVARDADWDKNFSRVLKAYSILTGGHSS